MDNTKNKFIPGLELGELFYEQIIKPILKDNYPNLIYSAALIGEGSEILGYDNFQSTDHCWGPRTMLFLSEDDFQNLNKNILMTLQDKVPNEFLGYSTKMDCPVKNTIDIFTIKSFFEKSLAFDVTKELRPTDWLAFPSQKLLEVTSGKVFHDDLKLTDAINKFSYYPKDVWLYILSCQWTKISQEEAFMGRCGIIGDEIGSRVVAARLVREIMKLCFLMEKKYAPYSKWFGMAFSKLQSAKELIPVLEKVFLTESWEEREKYLSVAYETVAIIHNSLKITEPLSTKVSNFYTRPYLIIHSDVFAKAIKSKIENQEIKAIETNVGSVDQFADSTDVLSNSVMFKKLKVWSN